MQVAIRENQVTSKAVFVDQILNSAPTRLVFAFNKNMVMHLGCALVSNDMARR